MLNNKEKKVMETIYELCGEEGRCLCVPWDILRRFEGKENMDEGKLYNILHDLQADGYFDVICSDRRGDPVYVIVLRSCGLTYRRENLQFKRSIYFKVALTVGGAVVSFLIGLLLRAFFS